MVRNPPSVLFQVLFAQFDFQDEKLLSAGALGLLVRSLARGISGSHRVRAGCPLLGRGGESGMSRRLGVSTTL